MNILAVGKVESRVGWQALSLKMVKEKGVIIVCRASDNCSVGEGAMGCSDFSISQAKYGQKAKLYSFL